MKILFLADPNSVHAIRWQKALQDKGITVDIVGINKETTQKSEGSFAKLKALTLLPKIKQKIRSFKPDILHSHYASSYGLLGALTGFHPFVISAWGSDIYSFPNVSFIHKLILKYSLSKSDHIFATSNALAKETQQYTTKEIKITPFGIDLDVFKPMKINSMFKENDIVIGTIKSLEEKYGIDYLIHAFAIVKKNNPSLSLKLLIVGEGPLEASLKKLVLDLNVDKETVFAGQIPHNQIPLYNNMLSIYVALSNQESFGVAVIEANACGKPVVVSDIGGLPEIVKDGKSGFVVPPRDPKAASGAIQKLLDQPHLREKMGIAGRQHIKELYDWNNNVEHLINIYKKII